MSNLHKIARWNKRNKWNIVSYKTPYKPYTILSYICLSAYFYILIDLLFLLFQLFQIEILITF